MSDNKKLLPLYNIGTQKQCPKPWFPDGNIIIMAGDTEFRVHEGFLAMKAPLLMQAIDRAASAPYFIEHGVRKVARFEESPSELGRFLDLMYNGLRYSKLNGTAQREYIHTMLRLGLKYGVEEQIDEAVSYLESLYPTEIEDWETSHSSCHLPEYQGFNAISLVHCTKRLWRSAPRLYYHALYDCCYLEPKFLIHGIASSDPGTPLHRLDPDDVVACLEAQKRLYFATCDLFKYVFTIPDNEDREEFNCVARESCLATHEALHAEIYNDLPKYIISHHPLQTGHWIQELVRGLANLEMCSGCLEWYLDRHTWARQKVLRDLPTFFFSPFEESGGSEKSTAVDPE